MVVVRDGRGLGPRSLARGRPRCLPWHGPGHRCKNSGPPVRIRENDGCGYRGPEQQNKLTRLHPRAQRTNRWPKTGPSGRGNGPNIRRQCAVICRALAQETCSIGGVAPDLGSCCARPAQLPRSPEHFVSGMHGLSSCASRKEPSGVLGSCRPVLVAPCRGASPRARRRSGGDHAVGARLRDTER
jgi:hypothetical protein